MTVPCSPSSQLTYGWPDPALQVSSPSCRLWQANMKSVSTLLMLTNLFNWVTRSGLWRIGDSISWSNAISLLPELSYIVFTLERMQPVCIQAIPCDGCSLPEFHIHLQLSCYLRIISRDLAKGLARTLSSSRFLNRTANVTVLSFTEPIWPVFFCFCVLRVFFCNGINYLCNVTSLFHADLELCSPFLVNVRLTSLAYSLPHSGIQIERYDMAGKHSPKVDPLDRHWISHFPIGYKRSHHE